MTWTVFVGCSGQPLESPLSRRIDEIVAPYLEAGSFSGTVLLARGDTVLHNAGYGYADFEGSVPNGPDTRFRIGSISKSFTAAAILLLVEQGDLDLADHASDFIAGFPFPDITVEHLLSHTSGLARFVFQPDYGERSIRPHSTRDLVDWISSVPAVSSPGERYGYSNANYSVLAHIIEQITEISYGEFVESEILGPTELQDTGDASHAARVPGLALGYHPTGLRKLDAARQYDYSIVTGAGSLYSSTDDLLAWVRTRNLRQLLDPATSDPLAPRVGTSLAYAWNVGSNLDRPAITLTGWDGVGFGARLVHYQSEGITVVVLANLNMSSIAGEVADKVAAAAFGDPVDSLELLEKPREAPGVLARDYAGVYRFGDDFYVPGSTIEFIERNGQLIVPAAPPAPEGGLLPLADGSFIHRQQWFRVRFDRDADGNVSGIIYDRFRARKEPAR
jgi:CubicO group peptidase (beta-lactamase class C family)